MFRSFWTRIQPHKLHHKKYRQFLTWLEESPAEWYFKNEKIRTDEDECPIAAISNRRFGTRHTTDRTAIYDAGRRFSLPFRLTADIMRAADVPDRLLKTRHREIRRDLINVTMGRRTSKNVTGGDVQDFAGQPSSSLDDVYAREDEEAAAMSVV